MDLSEKGFDIAWGRLGEKVIDDALQSHHEDLQRYPGLELELKKIKDVVASVDENTSVADITSAVFSEVKVILESVEISADPDEFKSAQKINEIVAGIREKLQFLKDFFDFQMEHLRKCVVNKKPFGLLSRSKFMKQYPDYMLSRVYFQRRLLNDYGSVGINDFARLMGFPVPARLEDVSCLRAILSEELWRAYNLKNGFPFVNREFREEAAVPALRDSIFSQDCYVRGFGSFSLAVRCVFFGKEISEPNLTERKDGSEITTGAEGFVQLQERVEGLQEQILPEMECINEAGLNEGENFSEEDEEAIIGLKDMGFSRKDVMSFVGSYGKKPVTLFKKAKLSLELFGKVNTSLFSASEDRIRAFYEENCRNNAEKDAMQEKLNAFLRDRGLSEPPTYILKLFPDRILELITEIENCGIEFKDKHWYLISANSSVRERRINNILEQRKKEFFSFEILSLYGVDRELLSHKVCLVLDGKPDLFRSYCKLIIKLGLSVNEFLNGREFHLSHSFRSNLRRKIKAKGVKNLRCGEAEFSENEKDWLERMELSDEIKEEFGEKFEDVEIEVLLEFASDKEIEKLSESEGKDRKKVLRSLFKEFKNKVEMEERLRKFEFSYADMDRLGENRTRIKKVLKRLEEIERFKIPVSREIVFGYDVPIEKFVDIDSTEDFSDKEKMIFEFLRNAGCKNAFAKYLACSGQSLEELRGKVFFFKSIELDSELYKKERLDFCDYEKYLFEDMAYIKRYSVNRVKSSLKKDLSEHHIGGEEKRNKCDEADVSGEKKVSRVGRRNGNFRGESLDTEYEGYMDSNDLFFRELGAFPLLSREEERELAYEIKRGSMSARDKFIKSNLRLVVMVAREYTGLGLDFKDLVQEGSIGLFDAVVRFDPERGGKFSTYGIWWIRAAIVLAIANRGGIIRIPVGKFSKINKIREGKEYLIEKLGRDPTNEELAEFLDIPVENIEVILEIMAQRVVLDEPVYNGDGASSVSILGLVKNEEKGYSKIEEKDSESFVLGELKKKFFNGESGTEREWRVLCYRFELEGTEHKTLEDIGVEFGVGRERIRQIENKGLKKLRQIFDKNPELAEVAKDWIYN